MAKFYLTKKQEDNKNYLKNKISYVPQDSFILDTTIKNNIAFGEKILIKKIRRKFENIKFKKFCRGIIK